MDWLTIFEIALAILLAELVGTVVRAVWHGRRHTATADGSL